MKLKKNISAYKHQHIDEYDTMNTCSKFEVILLHRKHDLIRNFKTFPRSYFLSKNNDKTQKMQKIIKYISL